MVTLDIELISVFEASFLSDFLKPGSELAGFQTVKLQELLFCLRKRALVNYLRT